MVRLRKEKEETAFEPQNGENGRDFRSEVTKVPALQGAGTLNKKIPTKEVVVGSSFVFAETALQLASKEGGQEFENPAGQIFDASSDAGEPL